MDGYDNDQANYEEDQRDYDNERLPSRSRSRSPRRDRDRDIDASRNRSASPNGRVGDSHAPPAFSRRQQNEEDELNAGSNLFVTSLSKSVDDHELRDLFSEYGQVENSSIVRDPHTRESRCFGFVKMATSDQAEAAIDKLQGFELKGKVISIEKAKRNRARTPTPGRYQGPGKRDTRRDRGGRFDDRRRRDDRGGYSRGGDSYSSHDRYGSDRGYDRSYRDRSDHGHGYGGGGGGRGSDAYASRRDDRYGGPRGGDGPRGDGPRGDGPRGDDRRGYGYSSGGQLSDQYGPPPVSRPYDDYGDRDRR